MFNELVQTNTADNLVLSGLFQEGRKDQPVLLYIHGYEGDFFSHKFITSIAQSLKSSEIGFLSVQTRGSFAKQELITTEGHGIFNGGDYELLEEAYIDIDAWITFLKSRGFSSIILAGHSLGTYKVVRYLFEGTFVEIIKKVILLCPFDKNWLFKSAAEQMNANVESLIASATHEVEAGNGDVIAPYGYDDVPHSFKNFLSWAKNDDIGKMYEFHDSNYNFPILQRIQVPVHTIVGTHDEFFHPSNPEHPEEAMKILTDHIPSGTGRLIQGAKHSFRGFESELAEEILNFINK